MTHQVSARNASVYPNAGVPRADLSVRWALADGGAIYADADIANAGYGDVSLRRVGGVSRAARARLAAIIEVALRMRGYDPTAFSIGGDPR